jgi:hypothetical protein
LLTTLSTGAGGGSEQWEHHIGKYFDAVWKSQHIPAPPAEHRKNLLSTFRKQKGREVERREALTMAGTHADDRSIWRITLTLDSIEDAWQKGLNRPLKTARREIELFARMVDSGVVTNPLVVVSGGTARNPAVKSRMLALCKENGVPVLFTDDFEQRITYE